MPAQLIVIWVAVSLIPTVSAVVLLVQEYRKNKALMGRLEKPVETHSGNVSSEWAQNRAYELIHSASKKADTILTEAELAGIKVAAEAKMTTGAFEAETQKQLLSYLKDAEQKYQKFIETLEARSSQSHQEIEQVLRAKINEIILKFEQNLSEFLSTSQQKSQEALSLELKSARQLIDSYKQQQLTIIDENIVAVLERTMSLVLKNRLSLKDQLDLVFEALERAKVEKFFA